MQRHHDPVDADVIRREEKLIEGTSTADSDICPSQVVHGVHRDSWGRLL
jgi:hypothetical protein